MKDSICFRPPAQSGKTAEDVSRLGSRLFVHEGYTEGEFVATPVLLAVEVSALGRSRVSSVSLATLDSLSIPSTKLCRRGDVS